MMCRVPTPPGKFWIFFDFPDHEKSWKISGSGKYYKLELMVPESCGK